MPQVQWPLAYREINPGNERDARRCRRAGRELGLEVGLKWTADRCRNQLEHR
jgi:hypothetical protein